MDYAIGNQRFALDDLPTSAQNTLPAASFFSALDAVTAYHDSKSQILADPLLSDAGKGAKIEPLANQALSAVLAALENLETESGYWEKREAELLAVGAPTTENEIARDKEVREWWRSITPEQRAKITQEVEASPAHGELVRALLRSPVPDAADIEKRYFRELHNQIRRLENPAEAVAIETGRHALAFGERGVGHIAGIALQLTGRTVGDLARLAVETGKERAAVRLVGAHETARIKASRNPIK